MKHIKVLLVSVLCLLNCAVFAQTGIIKGKVITYDWMFEGTPSAQVVLMQDALVLQTLKLDVAEDGNFEFAGLEEGYYDVRICVQAGKLEKNRTWKYIYVMDDQVREWNFTFDFAAGDEIHYPCGGGQTHWVDTQELPTSIKLSSKEIRRMPGM